MNTHVEVHQLPPQKNGPEPIGLAIDENSDWQRSLNDLRNGHKTDLEMSPGPLGTTIFEEIYIRIMGK